MPAPRNVTSSSACRLRAANWLRCSKTSCSDMPSGSFSGSFRRNSPGIASNRSSISPTPMRASMSRRSWSVADVYRVMAWRLSSGSAQQFTVRTRVKEAVGFGLVTQLHAHEPALAVRIVVHELGLVAQRAVHLGHLAGHRRDHVGDRLHG